MVAKKNEAKTAAAPQEVKVSAKAPLAHGVGRRKSAVARVWLRRGKGALIVNDKPHVDYFDTDITRQEAALPFAVYPNTAKYDVQANVNGGGLSAQADAIKLGIARALLELNPDIRPLLKEHGLLTVDSRVKERKKYGQKGARRKFQFVKR
jgi:small subunit ribosomal protein S9